MEIKKTQWGPGETHKLSFHSYNIIFVGFYNFAKTDAENLLALTIKNCIRAYGNSITAQLFIICASNTVRYANSTNVLMQCKISLQIRLEIQ